MISAAQNAYFQAVRSVQPIDMGKIEGLQGATGAATNERAARFSGIMNEFLKDTSQAQNQAKEFNYRLQMGDPSMSVEKATIQANVASLQFSAVMSTRNKLLEAYREIINTPV